VRLPIGVAVEFDSRKKVGRKEPLTELEQAGNRLHTQKAVLEWLLK